MSGGGPPGRGLFISFEGIDRSGKSTQAALLTEALGEEAILVREPGGTVAAENIRRLLLDQAVKLTAETEALLYAAARAELVQAVVKPAMERGLTVVADRFVDSSLAYQGGGRGLGIDEVERLNAWATGGLFPDLTILLKLDPEETVGRTGEDDRIEAEGSGLQRAVAQAYDELVERYRDRYVVIDATGDVDGIHNEVLAAARARRDQKATAS